MNQFTAFLDSFALSGQEEVVQCFIDEVSLNENVVVSQSPSAVNPTLAIASGCCLSLIQLADRTATSDREIEFDYSINAVCWGPDSDCVLVGDSHGTIHFLTSDGAVIFSHCILPTPAVSSPVTFISLTFHSEAGVTSSPLMIAMLSTGDVVMVRIPVSAVCRMAQLQPSALAGAVKKMVFLSCSLLIPLPVRAEVFQSFKDEFLYGAIVEDSYHRLHRTLFVKTSSTLSCEDTIPLATTVSLSSFQDALVESIQLPKCRDFVIVNSVESGNRESNSEETTLDEGEENSKLSLVSLHDNALCCIWSIVSDQCSMLSCFYLPNISCNGRKIVSAKALPFNRITSLFSGNCNMPTVAFLIYFASGETAQDTLSCVDSYFFMVDGKQDISLSHIGTHHPFESTEISDVGSHVLSQRIGGIFPRNLTVGTYYCLFPETLEQSWGSKQESARLSCILKRDCSHIMPLLEIMMCGRCCPIDGSKTSAESSSFLMSTLSCLVEMVPNGDKLPNYSQEAFLLGILLIPEISSCAKVCMAVWDVVSQMYKANTFQTDLLLQSFLTVPLKFESSEKLFSSVSMSISQILSSVAKDNMCISSGLRMCISSVRNLNWDGTLPTEWTNTSSLRPLGLLTKEFSDMSVKFQDCCSFQRSLNFLLRSPTNVWFVCLLSGCFEDANFIMKHHLSGRLSITGKGKCATPLTSLLEILCNVHRSIHFNAFVRWMDTDLKSLYVSSLSSGGDLRDILASCTQLNNFAKALEESDGNCLNAVLIISIAEGFMELIPCSRNQVASVENGLEIDIEEIRLETEKAFVGYRMQIELKKLWALELSFETIQSIGLQGVVGQYILSDVTEDALEMNIECYVVPFVQQFAKYLVLGNSTGDNILDPDTILENWVLECVQTLVVNRMDEFDGNESYERPFYKNSDADETVKLSRLILVTKQIVNCNKRAKCISTLLQLPVEAGSSSGSSTPNELCEMASVICNSVESKLSESLVEAIRSYKLRSLAQKYGIIHLEMRDKRQTKAAANVIACRWQNPNSINDAVEFASSWSSSILDLNVVLSRAIVLRAMEWNCVTDCTDPSGSSNEGIPSMLKKDDILGQQRDKLVRTALGDVPRNRIHIVIQYCCQFLFGILDDCCVASDEGTLALGSTDNSQQARLACQGLIVVISSYLDEYAGGAVGSSFKAVSGGDSSIYQLSTNTLTLMRNMRALQLDFDVYLSFHQLNDVVVCKNVIRQLASTRHGELVALGETNMNRFAALTVITPHYRRACALLRLSNVYFLHILIRLLSANEAHKDLAMSVADLSLEMEKKTHHESDSYLYGSSTSSKPSASSVNSPSALNYHEESKSILDVAMHFCQSSVKWASKSSEESSKPFLVSRDILRRLSINTSLDTLGLTLDVMTACDLVTSVHERFDNSVTMQQSGDAASELKLVSDSSSSSLVQCQSVVSGGNKFTKDGILLSSSKILKPLLRFAFCELQRRRDIHKLLSPELLDGSGNTDIMVISSAKETAVGLSPSAPATADIDEIVSQLQKSENHFLCVRILLSCWSMGKLKSQALQMSTVSLCRKILSYRDMDMELAVAYLSTVPYDIMVRELQSSIPAVQNDFPRLKTMAIIGEQLSQMWEKNDLIGVFQSLLCNARWWITLTSLGIKVDPRSFQSPSADIRNSCIRSIVPLLLERSSMDLEVALDYCRQFDLTCEFACTCYMEKMLLTDLSSSSGSSWKSNIRSCAANVSDKELMKCLREVLPFICPVDYDKIKFVCVWLRRLQLEEDECKHQLLSSDDEEDDLGRTVNVSLSMSDVSNQSNISVQSRHKKKETDIQKYDRYIFILDYLAQLVIPKAVIKSCLFLIPVDQPGKQKAKSSNIAVAPKYYDTIPFWTMMENPWSVMNKLLLHLNTEMVVKLAVLCTPVCIDKDSYYEKRIKVDYLKMSGCETANIEPYLESDQPGDSSTLLSRGFVAVDLDVVYNHIYEGEINYIDDALKRVYIWKWVYDQEKIRHAGRTVWDRDAAGDHEECISGKSLSTKQILLAGQGLLANRAVLAAIDILNDPTSVSPSLSSMSADVSDTCQYVRDELCDILLDVKCQSIVLHYVRQLPKLKYQQVTMDDFTPYFGKDPKLLAKFLLESSIPIAWAAQIRHYELFCPVHSPLELMMTTKVQGLANSVVKLVALVNDTFEKMVVVMDEISAMKNIHCPDEAARSGKAIDVDSLRHGLVGKLMTDINVESPAVQSPVNVGSHDASTPPSGSIASSGSTASAASLASFLGYSSTAATSSDPTLTSSIGIPTLMETKRREDMYHSFGIAVLVSGCVDENSRQTYLTQLGNVTKEKKGPKLSNKKISLRTRLRASMALWFLERYDWVYNGSEASSVILDSDIQREKKILLYLFCLVELSETRLPCSPESLASAMRVTTEGNGAASLAVEGEEAISLVKTWLFDEGHVEEVVELCRDVLLCTGVLCQATWELLMSRMDSNSHYRTLMCTLTLLTNEPSILSLNKKVETESPLNTIMSPDASPRCALRNKLFQSLTLVSIEMLSRATQAVELLTSDSSNTAVAGVSSFGWHPRSNYFFQMPHIQHLSKSAHWEVTPQDIICVMLPLTHIWRGMFNLYINGNGSVGCGTVMKVGVEASEYQKCCDSIKVMLFKCIELLAVAYKNSAILKDKENNGMLDRSLPFFTHMLEVCSLNMIGCGDHVLSAGGVPAMAEILLECGTHEEKSHSSNMQSFLWRVFCVGCEIYSKEHVLKALSSLSGVEGVHVGTVVLSTLLCGASKSFATSVSGGSVGVGVARERIGVEMLLLGFREGSTSLKSKITQLISTMGTMERQILLWAMDCF